MSLKLNVDGLQTENPSDSQIACGFESLDKGEARLLSGPGLSMVILSRSDTEDLVATGTYTQGFVLTHQDGRPEEEITTDMHQPVPVDTVIKMFQSYARGENWGKSQYQWERIGLIDANPRQTTKRLILYALVAAVAIAIIKLLANR
jgi:hypothetical protein